MPRRREVPKRVIIPDPRYGSQKLARFINKLMLKGKKSTAERIMYGAMDLIADRTSEDPLEAVREGLG